VSLFLLLKLIHISAAIVAVGTNISYDYWLHRAGTDRARLLDALEGIRTLDRRLANPAYGVLLITGLAMVFNVGYPLTTFWVAAAIVLYVLVAAIGIVGFAPVRRRQRAEAARDPTSADYRRIARRANLLGVVTVGALVVILFLMVFRPT
jgi:uncharacterized membrane protein